MAHHKSHLALHLRKTLTVLPRRKTRMEDTSNHKTRMVLPLHRVPMALHLHKVPMALHPMMHHQDMSMHLRRHKDPTVHNRGMDMAQAT